MLFYLYIIGIGIIGDDNTVIALGVLYYLILNSCAHKHNNRDRNFAALIYLHFNTKTGSNQEHQTAFPGITYYYYDLTLSIIIQSLSRNTANYPHSTAVSYWMMSTYDWVPRRCSQIAVALYVSEYGQQNILLLRTNKQSRAPRTLVRTQLKPPTRKYPSAALVQSTGCSERSHRFF